MNNSYAKTLQEASPVAVVTPTPMVLEKVGEKFRGVFLGLRPFEKTDPNTGEVRQMQVAHFYDGEGIRFNMGAQLTNNIRLIPVGVSVEITLTELKPNSKGGKTKIYSIAPLNVPKVKLEALFGGLLEITAPDPADLLPTPKAEEPKQLNGAHPASDKVRWVEFIRQAGATEAHVRAALGTNRVSEWLAADPERTIDDAAGLVQETMADF